MLSATMHITLLVANFLSEAFELDSDHTHVTVMRLTANSLMHDSYKVVICSRQLFFCTKPRDWL